MKKILPLLMLFMLMHVVNLCFAQATSGTAENFTQNSTANSTIGAANQNHWYKLVTTGDGNITLSATASQANGNTYMYLYLYDSDAATQLGSTGNYASNGGPSFTVNGLAKGTYYCLINSSDAFSNTYAITNSLALSPTNNDVELNDYFIQSLTINQNDSAKGHIGYRNNGGSYDQSDYYKLVLNTDANVNISYTGDFANPTGGNGYVYLYFFDKDSTTQLGTSSGFVSNGGASFSVNGLAAGTYYVRVDWGGVASYFTGYTLKNTITSPPTVNDAELNDFFNQSLIINENDSVKGHIGYRRNGGTHDESDFYKLVISTDANVNISYKGDFANPGGQGGGNGYAYIYLFDKDTIAQLGTSSGFVSNGGASFQVNGLAAGTYYVKIGWGGVGGYFTGYTLKNSVTSPPTVNDAELNDYFNQSLTINPNDSVGGHIGYRRNGGSYDESDFYKLVTGVDGNITIAYTGDFANPAGTGGGNGYAYLYLYDKDTTTQLGSSSGYVINGGASFKVNGLAAGIYYAKIGWGGGAGYFTGYSLKCKLDTATYVSDLEPNNTTATASLLNLNPNKAGHIGYRFNGGIYDTDDYWKIVMNTSDSMRVVVDFNGNGNANAYADVFLYDGSNNQLFRQTNYVVNQSSYNIYFPNLAAGNYYLRIQWGGSGAYYSSYKIPVFHVPCDISPAVITAGGPTTFCQGGSVVLNTTPTFTAYGQSNGYISYLWSNLATTQNITVTSSGNYSDTASDVDGCPHVSNVIPVTVNPIPATPTITAGGATTFCQGGSVTLTSSSATGNTWSTGATTQSITVTASGNYTVAVTANGCTSNNSATTSVTVNPLPATPTISAGGATTFCAGGSVVLTSTAATSYLWSTGATTQSITVNASGSYSVTVKNVNGCSSAASTIIAVTVNPLPATPTISAGGATTFCAGGSVTLTSSSATGNLWSTGATTQSINVNAGGNYSVTVTNGNGCSANSAATAVTVNPLPTVTLASFTAVCSNDAAFNLSGGSPAGGTYSGTGVSGGQFNPATAGVGTFAITYSYTNANGCTATAQKSITVNNCTAPCTASISAGGPTTFCQGGTLVLTASAGVSWLWSNGATTQSITVNSSGAYSVAVTDANNCTATAPGVTVTANPLPATPTISAGSSTTFCAGGSVTLTSSSATGNVWSTGATTQSITVNTAGSYSVTVTNGNGCAATSAATTVTVNPLPATPTISAGSSTTFCAGGSVTLTSSSATGNVWSTGATTQSINVNSTGNYSVIVTNGNGCTAASAAATVTVNPLPTVSLATFSAVCSTDAAFTLSGGAPAGGSYSGTGVSAGQFNPATAGVGTFVLTYSYTNGNGCTASAQQSITVNNCTAPCTASIAAGGPTTFCQGGNVTLTANAGTSYLWSTGATTQSITVNTGGSYTVTVTGANNCSATSAPTVVTVNPLPATPTISAASATTFCAGGSVTLTASAAASYAWSTGATTQSITVNSSGSYSVTVSNVAGCSAVSAATTVTVNPLPTVTLAAFNAVCSNAAAFTLTGGSPAGGTYSGTGVSGTQFNPATAGVGTFSINYSYSNANGCTNTASQTITVNNCTVCTATIIASKPTTFCQGGSVTLTANAGTSYLWSTGATTQSITVNGSGSYTVTVSNANNCSATSAATVVTVNPLPAVPTISAGGPTTFCQGGSVTLTSSAAASYAWSNGATTQSITVTSSGNYSVEVRNAAGCSRISAITAVVVNNCGGVYCAANGNNRAKGYISNVYLKTIFNNSGWSAGGYGNYLNQSATLNKRASYIISVSPGFTSFFNISGLYTRVWIDWNQDGDFNDAGELVFSPAGASYFLRLGIVNVPANALSGRTRMRVAMSASGYPSNCGSFAYGEVEDYSIVVSGSAGRNTEEVEPTEPVIVNESFKLYPNPVSEELVIQRSTSDQSKVVDASATMIMLDMNGRIVLKYNLTRSTEVIDVRKYPSGIYFIQLKTKTGITTQKIIISH